MNEINSQLSHRRAYFYVDWRLTSISKCDTICESERTEGGVSYMRNEIAGRLKGRSKQQDRNGRNFSSKGDNNDAKGCIEERVMLDTGSTRATH